MRGEYVLRETGSNLWRNVSLTVAAVITVSVSLTMFGTSLLIRNGANAFTERWRGGVEFQIYMNPDATAEQNEAIVKALQGPESGVRSYTYFDQQKSYDEFLKLFADEPELRDTVKATDLPPSYRVVPKDPDADAVTALASQFEGRPGVKEVQQATEVLRQIEDLSNLIKNLTLGAAIFLLVGSVLLILNTIHTAMTSRRREIEVMKLVGATNWFIRIPFMLEGLVHGLLGAGLSVGFLVIIKTRLFPRIQQIDFLREFRVTSSSLVTTSIWLLVAGCVVGVIGSWFAVSRYLDV